MYYLSLDESSAPDTLVRRYLKVDSKEIRISTPYSIEEDVPEDVPKRLRKTRHALGTDYGCCRDGVNIWNIYADATLCFLNLGPRPGRLPLRPHSV